MFCCCAMKNKELGYQTKISDTWSNIRMISGMERYQYEVEQIGIWQY